MNRPSFLLSTGVVALGSLLTVISGVAPATAGSLVPSTEGEVNVGLGAPLTGSYLGLSGFTVESLIDASTGTKSRLFVDRAGTNNTYGAGSNSVKFKANDLGTTDIANSYWFRPVAMQANGTTPLVENGQLEVGTFKFTFGKAISQLKLNFFDTEVSPGTRYSLNGIDWLDVAAGPDKNIQQFFAANVKTLFLDLGQNKAAPFSRTGDGVNFQLEVVDVPEPTTILGFAAIGAAFAARRRKTAQ